MKVYGFVLLLCTLSGYDALPTPFEIPDYKDAAQMARYVIHLSDWVSIATNSTSQKGFAFANLVSMSDGPVTNGSGVPYIYLTDLDLTGQDLEADNRCSIMATLAQSSYCNDKKYDPQDPRCVRILMSGKFQKITDQSNWEYNFAKKALFSRHPEMTIFPADHGFYFAKINLGQIGVLDFFGGIKHVSLEDYFNANSTSIVNRPSDSVKVVRV